MPTEKKLVAFFCTNALKKEERLLGRVSFDPAVRTVSVPCSSKIDMLSLIKAFESGADAVVIGACSQDNCSLVDGCHRAKSAVNQTKKMLEEIGLKSELLEIFEIGTEECPTSRDAVDTMIERVSKKSPFCPISASGSDSNPQNTTVFLRLESSPSLTLNKTETS